MHSRVGIFPLRPDRLSRLPTVLSLLQALQELCLAKDWVQSQKRSQKSTFGKNPLTQVQKDTFGIGTNSSLIPNIAFGTARDV